MSWSLWECRPMRDSYFLTPLSLPSRSFCERRSSAQRISCRCWPLRMKLRMAPW